MYRRATHLDTSIPRYLDTQSNIRTAVNELNDTGLLDTAVGYTRHAPLDAENP